MGKSAERFEVTLALGLQTKVIAEEIGAYVSVQSEAALLRTNPSASFAAAVADAPRSSASGGSPAKTVFQRGTKQSPPLV